MSNEMLKDQLKKNNVKQWELADALGINETVFCKRLRYELPKDKKTEYISKIREIAKKRAKK